MMSKLKSLLVKPIRWYLSNRIRRNRLIEKNATYIDPNLVLLMPKEVRRLTTLHRDLLTDMRILSSTIECVEKQDKKPCAMSGVYFDIKYSKDKRSGLDEAYMQLFYLYFYNKSVVESLNQIQTEWHKL